MYPDGVLTSDGIAGAVVCCTGGRDRTVTLSWNAAGRFTSSVPRITGPGVGMNLCARSLARPAFVDIKSAGRTFSVS
jgi:hypothetical protein